MLHVIPSHQGRPSDDPIFALNKEATERKAKGDSIVNGTVGSLLTDEGKLAILPTAARVVHEVPAEEWATYAPIAGSPDFLAAVIDDLFAGEPEMKACAVAGATPGGTGALRHAIANYVEPHHALLTTSYFWGPYQTLCDEADRKLATFNMFTAARAVSTSESFDKALARQITEQKRSLIFINDPCHNPPGYSMTAAEWRAVVERLLAHAGAAPITLFVDMAYYAYGAPRPTHCIPRGAPSATWQSRITLCVERVEDVYPLRPSRRRARGLCPGRERARGDPCHALVFVARYVVELHPRRHARDYQVADDSGAHESHATARRAQRAENAPRCARRRAFNPSTRKKAGLKYPRYEGGFFVTVFADDAMDRAVRMKEKGVFVVPSKGCPPRRPLLRGRKRRPAPGRSSRGLTRGRASVTSREC